MKCDKGYRFVCCWYYEIQSWIYSDFFFIHK